MPSFPARIRTRSLRLLRSGAVLPFAFAQHEIDSIDELGAPPVERGTLGLAELVGFYLAQSFAVRESAASGTGQNDSGKTQHYPGKRQDQPGQHPALNP